MISLTIQAILLAVGAALVAIVGKGDWISLWIVAAIAMAAVAISVGLLRIVEHRAASVSHVHRRIVLTEHQLPLRQRAMTLQKLFQQRQRVSAEIVEVLFDNCEADHARVRDAASRLIRGGFSHTRARSMGGSNLRRPHRWLILEAAASFARLHAQCRAGGSEGRLGVPVSRVFQADFGHFAALTRPSARPCAADSVPGRRV